MSLLSEFTIDDLNHLMDTNPYLRGYLHGYLGELALTRQLQGLPGVDSVLKIPDADLRKGDLEVVFKGVPITIECKSIGMDSVKPDLPNDSWVGYACMKNSDSRSVQIHGQERRIVNVDKGRFDILAVNCFAVSEKWDFVFIENKFLLERDEAPGFITSNVRINPIDTPGLSTDILSLLQKVFEQKTASSS
jgi:hypothetical protein